MIVGFFGFNGMGKTLSMVREMIHYDAIFCNFNYLARPKQKVFIGYDTDDLFKLMREYLDNVGGVSYIKKHHLKICLAIDEAGLNFPARSWKALTKVEAYLFAQHRKLGIDFLYTAQNPIMIDKILRYNTAQGAWLTRFFFIIIESWYQGFDHKKDNFMFRVFYNARSYYKYYDTLEIVESTKIYFEDDKAKEGSR
jgi:hypothetical protein